MSPPASPTSSHSGNSVLSDKMSGFQRHRHPERLKDSPGTLSHLGKAEVPRQGLATLTFLRCWGQVNEAATFFTFGKKRRVFRMRGCLSPHPGPLGHP
jgi:hypothetical protein